MTPIQMIRPILVGGLLAGVLDIAAALTRGMLRGGSPVRVLQAIASGVMGRPAFEGGWQTALLGLEAYDFIAALFERSDVLGGVFSALLALAAAGGLGLAASEVMSLRRPTVLGDMRVTGAHLLTSQVHGRAEPERAPARTAAVRHDLVEHRIDVGKPPSFQP